jgi:hypothetical protein
MMKRVLLVVSIGAVLASGPTVARVGAQASGALVVISQVYGHGGTSSASFRNDFVEVFNRSTVAVNLTGLSVQFASSTGTLNFNGAVLLSGVLQPGQYFLVGLASSGAAGAVLPTPNATGTTNMAGAGKVALVNGTTALACNGGSTPCSPSQLALILDLVGFGNSNFFEGAGPAPATSATSASARLLGGCTDTNQNAADFLASTPQPRNMASPLNACFTPPAALDPHDVQGAGLRSPIEGDTVLVRGVVTALVADGFFIQTPAADEDSDPATSEGLFVFTAAPPAIVAVGDLVEVRGAVHESVPPADPRHPPVTELVASGDEGSVLTVVSSGHVLPAPRVVGAATLVSDAAMESLEGMRVAMDGRDGGMVVVDPTGGAFTPDEASGVIASDGLFFATFASVARPVREAGIHALDHATFAASCASAPCAIPEFDGNPERLRVESDAQRGAAAVDVTSGQFVGGVTGVLHHADRTWTVFPDPGSLTAGDPVMTPTAAAAPTASQFTAASLDLGRLFDGDDDPATADVVPAASAREARLRKASAVIRNHLAMPDIIGVQNVENLPALTELADRVNADAGLTCPGSPGCYSARLEEGSDPAGLDVGFLVSARVVVQGVVQEGRTATFLDPDTGESETLFDRPPLVLRAVVEAPSARYDTDITVVVMDLRAMPGVDAESSGRARVQRQQQAEFMANLLQSLQASAPVREWGVAPVVALGSRNAVDPNDGLVDVAGTIAGAPAAPETVVLASSDLVSPNFADAAAGAYSTVGGGNTMNLDPLLVSQPGASLLAGATRVRINADFPSVANNDAGTPLRLSDRDPAVGYFTFPPDRTPPVLSGVPADREVEGNVLGGAVVTYASPTAVDSVDGAVPVTCLPASGATFPLGETAVACSAADEAGNTASAGFLVTVLDRTPPALTLPDDITRTAATASGATVTFSASATDIVSGSLAAACVPASGSLFPIGSTTVTCRAEDGSGNVAAGTFTITVLPPPVVAVSGSMQGTGHVASDRGMVGFTFHVDELRQGRDPSWLKASVGDRGRADEFVSAEVTRVVFSFDPTFTAGPRPASGINRVVFSGSGSWNGRAGYTFEVEAEERGEPARGRDVLRMVVRAADGGVVLDVAGTLEDGNIQSLPGR